MAWHAQPPAPARSNAASSAACTPRRPDGSGFLDLMQQRPPRKDASAVALATFALAIPYVAPPSSFASSTAGQVSAHHTASVLDSSSSQHSIDTASESVPEPVTPVSACESHDYPHSQSHHQPTAALALAATDSNPATGPSFAVPGIPELLVDSQHIYNHHPPGKESVAIQEKSADDHQSLPLHHRHHHHHQDTCTSSSSDIVDGRPAPVHAHASLQVPQLTSAQVAPAPRTPLRASQSTKSLKTSGKRATGPAACTLPTPTTTSTRTTFLRLRPSTSAGHPSSSKSPSRHQQEEQPPLPPSPIFLREFSPLPSSSPPSSSPQRPPTLRRVMSFFKRSSSNMSDVSTRPTIRPLTSTKDQPKVNAGASDNSLSKHSRRFSFHRSAGTTRSNSPPSPGDTPLEMASSVKDNSTKKSNRISMPSGDDFFNNSRKSRAHTGFSIRGRVVNFASSHGGSPKPEAPKPRARSVERHKIKREGEAGGKHDLVRQPWAIAPDAGVGLKARRLSLSLPDDFTVDIAELTKEFEYQHKVLGRHRKHIGKGATSKVTLMVRKGSPTELYAVKEFRSKSNSETTEDYENKIKSEFSIAKSLHHPNIVETIRLCTDHGRWNHVMEYASEGDLFSLVQKKYLKDEGRQVDRLCLFKQLCQGVNYLHAHGIAHRDIKLENLLVTKDSKIKITDFGVSEVFSGTHPGLREAGGQCGVNMADVRMCKPGICGSLPYIAPEVLAKNGDYDPRPLDVWSSAIVMINLTFGAPLWEKAELPNVATYEKIVSGWKALDAKREANPDFEATYPAVFAFEQFMKPPPLRRIVLNMLHPNPEKRLSMDQVVNDRWFKGVECCQLLSYDDPAKTIDASKNGCMKNGTNKIYCHNHLPPVSSGHGLPPMPGKPGY